MVCMGLSNSVWYPSSWRQLTVPVLVILMVLLHQSELFGLMDAGVIFGWMPVQFAYDVGYSLFAVVLLYWTYIICPDPPAEYRAVPHTEEQDAESSTTN